ncbi:MarR family winged helix-turn-helix transcriptional regulator [Nocardioides anomalus]|uniref:MarR family winged helix-turn-helix transcriptional regulator n=1 Tax=Nocardioides anomalus TaxID=2712223 RepID=UPI001E4DA089|nr:MarR family transcriptional regulator [Nocardioides anomalus]
MTSTTRTTRPVAEALYALGATVVRRAPRAVGLTAISTLATLERTGPRRVTDLAGVQGVSQPSMTSLVTGLERAGYVERRDDPTDKRAALVALTDAGTDTLRERRRLGTASVAELVDQLSPDDRASLEAALPALRRLRELDEEQRERA